MTGVRLAITANIITNKMLYCNFIFTYFKSTCVWSQQKGHAECIDAFLRAVRGEDVVLPSWEEIRNVTRATVLAREALRSGVAFRV
jgi:hypothetical protein